MSVHRNRSHRASKRKKESDGSFFLQLIICAAVICSFMLVKDTPLPGGRTPAQYITTFFNDNIHLDRWAQLFNPDAAVPAGGTGINSQTSE